MYELLPTNDEDLLFSPLDDESTLYYGAVGYLRLDFGYDGQRYWATWIDIQPHLKGANFKKEFNSVTNSLRFDGHKPPFESRQNLSEFCGKNPGKPLTARGNGYFIRTSNYSFYFRCSTKAEDYQVYIFAYDNRFLLPQLAKNCELTKCPNALEQGLNRIKTMFKERRHTLWQRNTKQSLDCMKPQC